MSYHGYIPLCRKFLCEIPHPPSVLEVGIDMGVTYFSLLTTLLQKREQFVFVGVDILLQENVKLLTAYAEKTNKEQNAILVEGNSLDILPKLVEQQLKFDLILLDGDHNYHTVSKELEYIKQLTYNHTLVVIDDYNGRWAEKDMFYAERPGYENNIHATKRFDTEKHGVKAAVDDFVAANTDWELTQPINGEPTVMSKGKRF